MKPATATCSPRSRLSSPASLGIALVQPRMATDFHAVRQRDDVFLLPPPSQLRAMTLGYKAAATDILWAKLILEYGVHWQEKRAFPDVTRYIDGILALEPDFPPIYDFVDTILLYPMAGVSASEEDARTIRRYLERGTRERPYDPKVWVRYGQFVAFMGPLYLTDKSEIDRWRTDGAMGLARGVELGADAQRSLAASTHPQPRRRASGDDRSSPARVRDDRRPRDARAVPAQAARAPGRRRCRAGRHVRRPRAACALPVPRARSGPPHRAATLHDRAAPAPRPTRVAAARATGRRRSTTTSEPRAQSTTIVRRLTMVCSSDLPSLAHTLIS